MELWIRSQDNEVLANVKNVRFCKMKKCEFKETPCAIKEFVESADAYCVECNGDFFGEYATRERCLEIIDEIQELLISDFTIIKNLNVCDDFQKRSKNTKGILYSVPNEKPTVEYHSLSAVVYEMPEK